MKNSCVCLNLWPWTCSTTHCFNWKDSVEMFKNVWRKYSIRMALRYRIQTLCKEQLMIENKIRKITVLKELRYIKTNESWLEWLLNRMHWLVALIYLRLNATLSEFCKGRLAHELSQCEALATSVLAEATPRALPAGALQQTCRQRWRLPRSRRRAWGALATRR